jgi:nucleoside-diphosphate-sugar epimerase
MRVLVAGCGYVGSKLAEDLVAAGHRVHGLRRDVSKLPPGVRPVAADLDDPASLRSAVPRDVDKVVYAAGAGGREPEAYRDAYVRGPRRLAEALGDAPMTRFVLVTSTAVYGQDGGEWVDETSETSPTSFTGEILREGEQALLDGPLPGVVLRLSGIYGPGRTWMVRKVFHGEARVEPPGHQGPPRYGNRIHRDDCAGALAHLLTLEDPEPVYVGVDDAPDPLAEVYAFLAERLGVEVPPPGEVGRGRGGNKRCSNARLKASGYALRIPSYREGYPPIVRDFLAERARSGDRPPG